MLNDPSMPRSSRSIVHICPDLDRADGVADYQLRLYRELNEACRHGLASFTHSFQNISSALLQKSWPDGQIFHFQLPMQGWRRDIAVFRFPLALRRRAKNARIIVTLHEWGDTAVLRRAVNLMFLTQVDHIVVPSMQLETELTEKFWGRFLPVARTVQTIPIGPNHSWNGILPATRTPEFRIGYFGFIYPDKHPYLILNALRELLNEGHSLKLVIVGDFLPQHESLRYQFARWVDELNLKDHIEWNGFIADEAEAMGILATCDSFILLNRRGFTDRNGSVLTCTQFGRPVITSANYSEHTLPSWVSELVSVKLLRFVDDRKGVTEIISTIRSLIQDSGVEKHKKFDIWPLIVDKYVKLYHNLTGPNG